MIITEGQSTSAVLIRALESIGDGIARTFGANCEVVIHDLRRPHESVVRIFNSQVTGRTVGAPIRDLIIRVFRDEKFRDGVLANYKGEAPDGRTLKSTTVLVRDERDEPIAALCINFDISLLHASSSLLESFLVMDDLPVPEDTEVEVPGDVWQTLEHLVDRVISSTGLTPSSMQTEDRRKVVGFLAEKGAFLIRGSVDYVATKLGVSKFTIYNYIDQSKAGEVVPE